MSRLLLGDRKMATGPAMHRLIDLLEAQDNGEWSWISNGPESRSKYWSWEGTAECEKKKPRQVMKLNFATGRLEWASNEVSS